jgi:hypothetical protein
MNNNLQNLLLAENDALQSYMYKCKTIHIRYSMKKEHREFLLRQSILGIYAEWERFIKKSISLYLQEINREKLSFNSLHENYVSYQTDQLVKFNTPKTNFGTITKISKNLYEMYQDNVVFSTNVNTESNANLKVTNSILNKLRLKCLDLNYDYPLNKLLRFRNSIAHGDEGIPVIQKDVDQFTLLVQDMATDLLVTIIQGYLNRVYISHNKA